MKYGEKMLGRDEFKNQEKSTHTKKIANYDVKLFTSS